LPGGHSLICATEDFSMGGMSLRMPGIFPIEKDMDVQVSLFGSSREFVFPGKVVSVRNTVVSLEYPDLTLEQEKNLVRCTFGRADAWISWSEDPIMDRPLNGFKEIVMHSVQGFAKFGTAGVSMAWQAYRALSLSEKNAKKNARVKKAELTERVEQEQKTELESKHALVHIES